MFKQIPDFFTSPGLFFQVLKIAHEEKLFIRISFPIASADASLHPVKMYLASKFSIPVLATFCKTTQIKEDKPVKKNEPNLNIQISSEILGLSGRQQKSLV